MRCAPWSPEGDLLRRCLAGADEPARGRVPLRGDALAGALAFHRVSCTLHPVLAAVPDVPDEALAYVRARRFDMATSLVTMQADLMTVTEVMATVGAPWVVVKGPVTAMTLYGQLQRREWADLDVVVDRRAFGDVLAALEAAGAELLDRNWSMVADRVQAELSLQLPHGTALDLHWHVLNSRRLRGAFAVDVDDLLARRRTVGIGALTVPALSPEDQLLHLALHACLSGGHRLQWLKDVQLAAAGTADWEAVLVLARQWGVELPVAIMLERARDVLAAPVPSWALRGLAPRAGWRAVAQVTTRSAPPQESHHAAISGRIAFMRARATTTATAAEVLRHVPARLRHRGVEEAAVDNPLRHAAGTTADRASYLARVAGVRQP